MKRLTCRSIAPMGLLILLLFLVACASFSQNAYKGLAVSQQTYDATLTALGDFYKQGKVTEQVKAKAIEIGNLYKVAHNSAVQALLDYDAAQDQATQDTQKAIYMKQVAEASKQLALLLDLVKPYVGGTK